MYNNSYHYTRSLVVVRYAVASCTSVVAGLWSYIVRHLRVPVDLSATQVDHIAKFAIRVLPRRALGTDDLCLSGLSCDVVGLFRVRLKRSYSVIETTTHHRPVARYFETRPLSVTITLCRRRAQCKSVMCCRGSPCRALHLYLSDVCGV
jgi:hypothetical protein